MLHRHTPEVARLLPELYLHGLASGDFTVSLLMLIAGLADGTKVVLAVENAYLESTASWVHVLRDLTARGLRAPACVIADGAFGLWSAVAQVWPMAADQRSWNHKRRYVVDTVPLKHQPDVPAAVQGIAAAASVAEAERERQAFHRTFAPRFPKASERVDRDCARMLTYYQFLRNHWRHLRTTTVVSLSRCVR